MQNSDESRRRGGWKLPAKRRAPPNSILYAVGDLHGRLDLLKRVTDELRRAAANLANPAHRVTAIFLGDYIDRGPDSRGVISHLIDFAAEGVCETVFLRGNHEQILLDLVDRGVDADPVMWLNYGGLDTLRSYGADAPASVSARDADKVSERVRVVLPPEHLAFIRSTQLSAERGDYLFVHAGLRPDRLLSEQSEVDLLWHRFIDDRQPAHGKVVVHGHTPRERPVVGHWRIGLDTEAHVSGALTVLRLEGDERQLLKVLSAAGTGAVSIGSWDLADHPRQAGQPHHGSSHAAGGARSAGGQGRRVMAFTRMAFAAVLLGMIVTLAWLYIDHAVAAPRQPPQASRVALRVAFMPSSVSR